MGTLPHRQGTQGGCPAFATGSAMENYLRWGAAGPRDRFSLSRKKVRIPFFMFAKGLLEWMTLLNFDFEANFTVLDCLHLDSCWVVCPGCSCLILLIVLGLVTSSHSTTIGWQIPVCLEWLDVYLFFFFCWEHSPLSYITVDHIMSRHSR